MKKTSELIRGGEILVRALKEKGVEHAFTLAGGFCNPALEGFMKSIAVEYAKDNIQLNCLAPGFVESSYANNFKKNKKHLYDWTISQIPMGRWGKCDEMAELALFLVSNKNSYMTGSVIYSDGGWTA